MFFICLVPTACGRSRKQKKSAVEPNGLSRKRERLKHPEKSDGSCNGLSNYLRVSFSLKLQNQRVFNTFDFVDLKNLRHFIHSAGEKGTVRQFVAGLLKGGWGWRKHSEKTPRILSENFSRHRLFDKSPKVIPKSPF